MGKRRRIVDAIAKHHQLPGIPYPMRVHGHHSTSCAQTKLLTTTPLRAIQKLVERDEKVNVAFIANNLGKWALDHHILRHSAAGMINWFNVQA